MNSRSPKLTITALALTLVVTSLTQPSDAASFVVEDQDFVSNVYDFHYYAKGDKLSVNGVEVLNPALTLKEDGWDRTGLAFFGTNNEQSVAYWQILPNRLSGEMTMGWDLNQVTGPIAKVEIVSTNILFQFLSSAPHAFEDEVFGDVATPDAFGQGPYTNIYTHVGNGDGSQPTVGPEGNGPGPIIDITSLLDSNWLQDPGLLELRFGYQQHPIDAEHPTVPINHIQLFRDFSGMGDESFLLRVTQIPEPSCLMLACLGFGLVAIRRYRSQSFSDERPQRSIKSSTRIDLGAPVMNFSASRRILLASTLFAACFLTFVPHAQAASFVVGPADFDNGVYEMHYTSKGDVLTIGDTTIVNPALTLTEVGYDRTGSVNFPGPSGPHTSTYWFVIAGSPSGEVTMGWDLSDVNETIAKVEILTNHVMHQFDPFGPHALGDRIIADVATPAAFGTGPYTNLYEKIGGVEPLGEQPPGAEQQLFDITSFLEPGWLTDPGLLELRFGYQQHPVDAEHPDIPPNHIQLFRDETDEAIDGFRLKVTLVPEPNSLALLGLSALAAVACMLRDRHLFA